MPNAPHILVCEDDASLRYATARHLKAMGYEVEEAGAVADALAVWRRFRPDVALVDVHLPDGSGRELMRQARLEPELARTIVVLVSGVQTSPDFRADALEEGADGYLVKPVDARALAAQVRALLRLRDARAALVNQQARELRSMGEGSAHPANAVPLRASPPFAGLATRYGEVLERALEERAFRTERVTSKALRALAEELVGLRAGPRDVVDLHLSVLGEKTRDTGPGRTQALVEEGRLVVLELMGEVAGLYRARCG